MKLTRIIALNVCAMALLLFVVNAMAALVFDIRTLLKSDTGPSEQANRKIERSYSLAPYKDKDLGYRILGEVEIMGTEYQSFTGWSRKPYQGKTTTVNAAGDRQHTLPAGRPSGIVRLFGGSAMWGRGATDDGTIPALINQLFPTHHVYNHGEAGFTSRQSLARLINLANQGEELGTVVFYDGVNDVFNHCWEDGGLNTHGRARHIQRLLDGNVQNDTLLGRLEKTSLGPVFLTETYKLLLSARAYLFPDRNASRQSITAKSRCQNDLSHARRAAATLIENWKLAKSIVQSRGGKFIGILQPVIYVGRPSAAHVTGAQRWSHLEADYKTVYPLIQSELRGISAEWAADFTGVFDVDVPLYIDFCHVTETGNRLVATRIANKLSHGNIDDPTANPIGDQARY